MQRDLHWSVYHTYDTSVTVHCQGVPVRIELGPRDVSKGVMVMVRRDTGAKITSKLDEAVESLKNLLEDIHETMFSKYVIACHTILQIIEAFCQYLLTMGMHQFPFLGIRQELDFAG